MKAPTLIEERLAQVTRMASEARERYLRSHSLEDELEAAKLEDLRQRYQDRLEQARDDQAARVMGEAYTQPMTSIGAVLADVRCDECGRLLRNHVSLKHGKGPVCRGFRWDPKVYRRHLRLQEHSGSQWAFAVKSFTRSDKTYYPEVNTETGEASCDCKDFVYRGGPCKHLKACMAYLRRKGVV